MEAPRVEIKTSMGTFQVEVGTAARTTAAPKASGALGWAGMATLQESEPAHTVTTVRQAAVCTAALLTALPPACRLLRCTALCLQVYPKHAPRTCKNFLELARKGYYDGTVVSDRQGAARGSLLPPLLAPLRAPTAAAACPPNCSVCCCQPCKLLVYKFCCSECLPACPSACSSTASSSRS